MLMVQSIDDLPRGIVPRREKQGGHRKRRERASMKARISVAEIKAVVLRQPHRKGSDEWGRSTAIGRLLADGLVKPLDAQPPRIALDAAHRYLQAFNGYRWAITSRRPWAGTTPASTRMHVATYAPEQGELVEAAPARRTFGSDADEVEAVERALAYWSDVERAVRDKVPDKKQAEQINKALQFAVLDEPSEDWRAPFWVCHYLPQGLKVLIDHFGCGE
jgi:hypothetical protein